jgi:putative pyruvate formate lyase activating enzyme
MTVSAFPHFGEEDCLRGWNSSGTIFGFTTSRMPARTWTSRSRIRQVRRRRDRYQRLPCSVAATTSTSDPEHGAQVIEAIAAAVPKGLRLPIVYNTSAYDSVASLRLLDGLVDIYMPDFKFWSR